MKFLPQTRGARIRFALIFLVLVVLACTRRPDRVVGYHLSNKQEGDIVFQPLPEGELVEAIEGISRSEWSHCGILIKYQGDWHVAEAIGEVRYTPLHAWIIRGRKAKVESYRVNQLPADAAPKIKAGIAKLIGRSYDFRYAPDDTEIYCSELVNKVYARELGIELGTWERLGDLNWQPYEKFIRHMESGPVPLDRPMVTPVSLTRGPAVTRVFP